MWRTVKKPTLRVVTVPQDALLKLLIDGVEREGPIYRRKFWLESNALGYMQARFGEVTAKVIRNRLEVEREVEDRQRQAARTVEHATRRAEEIRKEAHGVLEPLRVELCAALSLDANADVFAIRNELAKLKRDLAEHPANERLQRFTNSVRRALDNYGFKEETAVDA